MRIEYFKAILFIMFMEVEAVSHVR